MSFKSREKKRRYRAATTRDRKVQRNSYPDRHYLTIVSRAGCCNDCGGSLRLGKECVYRREPREILCKNCADLRKIRYRPSRKWEKANRRVTQGRLAPAARKAA